MTQLNFHNQNNSSYKAPPPQRNLPIIQKIISAYKQWQSFIHYLPKQTRYTLGEKIDLLFIEILELIITARYLSQSKKLPILQRTSLKLDLLKFFLQISWEIKALDTKKYILLSEPLNEIGKILGGWQKQVMKTPPNGGE